MSWLSVASGDVTADLGTASTAAGAIPGATGAEIAGVVGDERTVDGALTVVLE